MKFVPAPGFSNREWWLENRERLVMTSPSQWVSYRDDRLRAICSHFGVSFGALPILASHPAEFPHNHPCATLQTSGTLTGKRRSYKYPLIQYETIEAHHWWRIEREHGLEVPGVIVGVFHSPYYYAKNGTTYLVDIPTKAPLYDMPLDRPEAHIFGPFVKHSVGSHNEFYQWACNHYSGPERWRAGLGAIRDLNPKAVLITPSQIQTAWGATGGGFQFSCPAVTTGEMLDDPTRDKALQMFPRVIDKMRCWDGGLGFFECRHGRRHIYDELAFVEECRGRLVSTDYFNYCHPFLRYANGDTGEIKSGDCACGTWGHYLSALGGRINQRIIVKGVAIPGTSIVQEISNFFLFNQFPNMAFSVSFAALYPENLLSGLDLRWRLHQDAAGHFRFAYDLALEDDQVAYLRTAIRFLVLRDGGNVFGLHPQDYNRRDAAATLEVVHQPGLLSTGKHLAVTSDLAIN